MSDIQDVQQLIYEYCHRIDRGPGDTVAELFTTDGVLDLIERRYDGRVAIDTFYRRRATRGLTSRHSITNILVNMLGPDEADVACVLLLFRELAGSTPVIVADYHDRVVRQDGAWLFKSKRLEIVFRAS